MVGSIVNTCTKEMVAKGVHELDGHTKMLKSTLTVPLRRKCARALTCENFANFFFPARRVPIMPDRYPHYVDIWQGWPHFLGQT